jgi:hypothetical protein
MRLFTFFTKSKDVHPSGLSIKKICPDKNSSAVSGKLDILNKG